MYVRLGQGMRFLDIWQQLYVFLRLLSRERRFNGFILSSFASHVVLYTAGEFFQLTLFFFPEQSP